MPLATPLIAGPGALASTVFRLLGEPFLRLASRIAGIILFAIAVDFVLDGLQVVFET